LEYSLDPEGIIKGIFASLQVAVMGQPGKIAFPVILVLGAITGYITYSFFTAAIPQEDRLDSPYYQPLSPASGGNEPDNSRGAAQQQQREGGGAAQQQQQQGGGGANQTQGETTTGGGAGGGGAATGGLTINILEGSSIQGSPDYDPEELTASAGAEVSVVNQDTLPHSATSGTGPQDPNSAQLFDTSLINAGESATLSLAQVTPGQYDYYCIVHPYMTGKIVVQ
jgi:plastocyanin